MFVVLSGSMQFLPEMEELAAQLRNMGHTTQVPVMHPSEAEGYGVAHDWNEANLDFATMTEEEIGRFKGIMLDYYLGKVMEGDALLVVNPPKHGVDGYIGPNTFLEMGVACAHKKPIYLWYPLPHQNHREELLGMQTVVLNQDLSALGWEVQACKG